MPILFDCGCGCTVQLSGCYADMCVGTVPQKGWADVVLVGQRLTYQQNVGEVIKTVVPEHHRFNLDVNGCWTSCELLRNDLFVPSTSYYLVTIFVGGKRCERWKVVLTAEDTGIISVHNIGVRISDGDTSL